MEAGRKDRIHRGAGWQPTATYIFHAQKVGQSFRSAAGLLPGVLRRRTEQFFTGLAADGHSEAPSGSSARRAEALPHRDVLKM